MADARSRIPSVERLLREAEQSGLLDRFPRAVVRDSIRELQNAARSGGAAPADWLSAASEKCEQWQSLSLRPVINATGVVLHTNLGRAPLSDAARDAVAMSLEYSSLEIDLDSGSRGSRYRHATELLCRITGAEAAHVTVNAASALMLCLNTHSDGLSTVVSRGELVEIGGSFRLPSIMEKSGAALLEVGTTNRTHLSDYVVAIRGGESAVSGGGKSVKGGEGIGALLKVHRSNFVQSGYTAEVGVCELVELGERHGIPVINDVGSGLLTDLSEFGLAGEPLVPEVAPLRSLTVFSGDKLMGGPQAGIIVGPSDLIEPLARNPMARALRPDKVTLAALEATLHSYLDRTRALKDIPVLRMLTETPGALKKRARRLAKKIEGAATVSGQSSVGGGSFPHASLETTLVTIPVDDSEAIAGLLRKASPAVLVQRGEGEIRLDPRTMPDSKIAGCADIVNRVVSGQ